MSADVRAPRAMRVLMEIAKGDDADQRIILGLLYGYPVCCITHFIHRSDAFGNGELIPIPEDTPLLGSGFVPCPECSKQSEDELRARIAKYRIEARPFPIPPDEQGDCGLRAAPSDKVMRWGHWASSSE